MPKLEARFGKSDYLIKTRRKRFRGFLRIDTIKLKHKLFLGGWSSEIERELLVREDAVGVLLFDPKRDEIVLVRQFRVGLVDKGDSPWILELVAGMAEAEEQLEEVAIREVREESNVEVSDLIKICDYFNSPGVSSEKVRLYLGIVTYRGRFGCRPFAIWCKCEEDRARLQGWRKSRALGGSLSLSDRLSLG